MRNRTAQAIADGNEQMFNAIRGAKVFIGADTFKDKNLARFDFRHTLFDGVHFKRCQFEDVKLARFTNCTFDKCTFRNAGPKNSDPSFEDLIFHDCKFKNSTLSITVLKASFVKTTFNRVDFKGTLFLGPLRVEDCSGFCQSANLRYSDRKVGEVTYEGNDPAWHWRLTSWEGLRFLLSIPVTKISWLLFFAHAAILGLAYATIHAAERLKPATIETHPDISAYLSSIRPWITESAFLQSVSQNILISLVLLMGSILFTYACPKEIKGYDRQQWIYELDQKGFIYDHISYLRSTSRIVACIFIAVALGFLAAKYTRPIVQTSFRLVDLAVSMQRYQPNSDVPEDKKG